MHFELQALLDGIAENGITAGDLDRREAELASYVHDLLQAGDVETIETFSSELSRLLASANGRLLEDREPTRFARWTVHLGRINAAAESASESAIERLLRSFNGKAKRILLYLAELDPSASISQMDLRESLDIETTYASRILARLMQADLILQWPVGRTRQVRITAQGRAAIRSYGAADFPGIRLSRSNLQDASMPSAVLAGAALDGCSLRDADLRYCDLSHSDLSGADLTGANLTGANLSYAILANTNFEHAMLDHANITGAHIYGANLAGCSTVGWIIDPAKLTPYDRQTLITFGLTIGLTVDSIV